MNFINSPKLSLEFYQRDVVLVAKDLLGKTFIRNYHGNLLAGKIVEVEAYDESEEASHSFNGRSERTEIMFERGGFLYVYFIYGVHYCCNVVTGTAGHGAAVLIRALEPLNNLAILAQNRLSKTNLSDSELLNLTSGPAKLCKALNISTKENGLDLCADTIYILDAPTINKDQIITTTRIGISKAVELPWRFYIKDNNFVSKKR